MEIGKLKYCVAVFTFTSKRYKYSIIILPFVSFYSAIFFLFSSLSFFPNYSLQLLHPRFSNWWAQLHCRRSGAWKRARVLCLVFNEPFTVYIVCAWQISACSFGRRNSLTISTRNLYHLSSFHVTHQQVFLHVILQNTNKFSSPCCYLSISLRARRVNVCIVRVSGRGQRDSVRLIARFYSWVR